MPILPLIISSRTTCISVSCGSEQNRQALRWPARFHGIGRIAVIRPDSDRHSALAPVQAMAAQGRQYTRLLWW